MEHLPIASPHPQLLFREERHNGFLYFVLSFTRRLSLLHGVRVLSSWVRHVGFMMTRFWGPRL
jgi:hypothetical protein